MVKVELVPYDPAWAARFEALRARLAEALGARATRIEHMGSTSIPGCDAKPILDVLVARGPDERFDAWRPLLAPLGFTEAREDSTSQGEGQWFFRDRARTVHVHVYPEASPGLLRHLAFRDALRADPRLRDEYVALKRRLAERDWPTVQDYADAKTPFVRRVEAEAQAPRRGPADP